MKISVFSKFEMHGGSELRCVELANGIKKYTSHESFLLAEKKVSAKLKTYILDGVTVVENSLDSLDYFYNSDCIIVVNTDVNDFSNLDYWLGKSSRHNKCFDIEKLKNKKMFFLYNFIINPSRHLHELVENGIDVRILTTNRKFFDEITEQDRYEDVRTLPRHVLVSPIDQNRMEIFLRNPGESICFGMHSKGAENKWNDEIEKLIKEVNERYGTERVKFRFMGMKGSLRDKISKIPNVVCLKEDEESVKEFVSKLDVFLFFPDWRREEPWARVVAESMVSGCPVIALDKGGTKDQVLKHNNGFLCKNYNDYYKSVVYLIEHPERICEMSKNSMRISKSFYSEAVISSLVNILNQ